MNLCSSAAGTIVAEAPLHRRAFPAPCNRWECPECGEYKKSVLYHRLRGHKGQRFMTLTCNPARYATPNEAYRSMSLSFTSLVKRVRRKYPAKRFEYVMVWEQTRKGWPHLHVLVSGPWIEQAWLSRQWDDLTGAAIVDIRYVRSGVKTASYLSKYLTKELRAPRGHHRWRKSFDYFPDDTPPPQAHQPSEFSWRYTRLTLAELDYEWRLQQWHTSMEPDGTLIAHSIQLCFNILHEPAA